MIAEMSGHHMNAPNSVLFMLCLLCTVSKVENIRNVYVLANVAVLVCLWNAILKYKFLTCFVFETIRSRTSKPKS